MEEQTPPIWQGFVIEQAELILDYLRQDPHPDPDFVLRHALTLTQAAELGRPDRARPIRLAPAGHLW